MSKTQSYEFYSFLKSIPTPEKFIYSLSLRYDLGNISIPVPSSYPSQQPPQSLSKS
jgi:hypothetical protein